MTAAVDLETAWACDFETTTEVDYREEGRVRVYLWHVRSLDDSDRDVMGTDIEGFIEWLSHKSNGVKLCIFHNLKFDGHFILDYCLRHGWEYGVPQQRGTREHPHRSVDTLITDLGQWMSMTLKFGDHVVKFMDSAKKFPGFSLQKLAEIYGIEGKSDLDVYRRRPEGTPLTEEEITRVKGDTRILRVAMRDVLGSGMTKLTMASDAKAWFEDSWNQKHGKLARIMWNRAFPPLPNMLEQLFRKAYLGGWVYLNEAYREQVIEDVHVFDVNSMFPAQMVKMLPSGAPQHRPPKESGETYIVSFSSSFRLRPGKRPFLHQKKSMYYTDSEFVTDSNGIMELVLCEPDFKLFLECYDTDFIINREYWSFRLEESPFTDYIEYWMTKKKEAKTPEDKATAKRFLNSLYGKTSENSEKHQKIPYFDVEDDRIKYEIIPTEGHNWYLPAGIWITAYARTEIVHFAEKFGGRFVYSDTDSVHVIGGEVPEGMPIDPKKLGWWKHESISERAVYVGPKKYVHENVREPGKDEIEPLSVACAGMPDKCKTGVTIDNFRTNKGRNKDDPIGKFPGKLAGRTVPGGYVLLECDYVIRV